MSSLYYLDLIGELPEFYFNKDTRHRSLIGTIITSLCFLSCIFIIIQTYFDIFNLKNMLVIFNKNTNNFPFMNMSSYPFLITLTDNYGNQIKDIDKLIRTHAMYIESDGPKSIMKNITLEKCQEEKLGDYGEYLNQQFNLSNYYCIPPNKFNISLYGVQGDKFNKLSNLQIFITKCFNDGYLPRIDCLNNSIIDKRLNKVLMNVIYIDTEIDHNNFDQPYKEVLKSIVIPGSSTVYRKYVSKKKTVSYTSDFGIFLEDFKTQNFFQHDYTESFTDLRVDDTSLPIFMQYAISFSSDNDVYLRKFIKYQSLVGNLSFVFKVIFYIGKIISNYFSNKILYLNIYNKIFSKTQFKDEVKKYLDFKYSLEAYRKKK